MRLFTSLNKVGMTVTQLAMRLGQRYTEKTRTILKSVSAQNLGQLFVEFGYAAARVRFDFDVFEFGRLVRVVGEAGWK